MNGYKLMAIDMDGTLLNSKKQITAESIKAINAAVDAGKLITINTGRGLMTLSEYLDTLSKVQYICGMNGSYIYSMKNKSCIYSEELAPRTVMKILQLAAEEDIMVNIIGDKSVIQTNQYNNMEKYHMGLYKNLYRHTAEKCDNLSEYYCRHSFKVRKIDMFHTSTDSRSATINRIQTEQLDVSVAIGEITSLEISARGVTKGSGLKKLCEYLTLSPFEVIAIGDSHNDLSAFSLAALSIAMGNASPEIKAAADVVVSDCDNNGLAEAIYKYFLN